MINSMTGFGKGRAGLNQGELVCDLRSVNHRGFSLYIKLPEGLLDYEAELRDWLKGRIKRGKVTLTVTATPGTLAGEVTIDEDRAGQVATAARGLQGAHPHLAPLSLGELLLIPGVLVTAEPAEREETVRKAIFSALATAFAEFNAARGTEGANLVTDLRERLAAMQAEVAKIRVRAADLPRLWKAQLESNLAKLATEVKFDPERIAQEIAIAAERCDINEELVRLTSHFEQLAALLEAGGELGRKLDFLAQELLREANTIGSKAGNLDVARSVLALKGEIDKVKEQVQNLE